MKHFIYLLILVLTIVFSIGLCRSLYKDGYKNGYEKGSYYDHYNYYANFPHINATPKTLEGCIEHIRYLTHHIQKVYKVDVKAYINSTRLIP